jgi:hypothetical protein
MKKIIIRIVLGLLMATAARANTTLTISSAPPYGCFQNANANAPVTSLSNSFTLSDVTGEGSFLSSASGNIPTFSFPPLIYSYGYTINVSNMTAATDHCITLVVHFGAPEGCDSDTVWASPSQIQSATLAPFGDITFVFHGGCLSPALVGVNEPGQPAVSFAMFTENPPVTGVVTIIDNYTDPQNGLPVEFETNVTALVPDIPPDPPWWERIATQPVQLPFPIFQGWLNTNGSPSYPTNPVPFPFLNGPYDLALQLVDSPTNGYAVSSLATQTVQVVNGLFTVPLPFDPISLGNGSERWLNIGVRPSGLPAVQFTPIAPMPLTPTPQAFYAYTAGAVADLAPGQAVTSLNGLTGAVNLQAGNGIAINNTGGNTITISMPIGAGAASDRNIKTDFTAVNPQNILAKLAGLPIQNWRYTNEVAGISHVGPMAQDFKATFGLGSDDKIIAFVDEEGVALAAIQGLNKKVDEKDAEIKTLQQQNDRLAKQLNELAAAVKILEQKNQDSQ